VRIVQLTDFYRPTIGGLERHVETLSRESAKNFGHDVTVITLRNGDLPEREEIDGVRVVRINGWSTKVSRLYADPSRPFHPTFPDPGALASLRKAIAEAKPDIVHSHSWIEYSYYPLYDASPGGPGHVITLHDYGLSCAKKTYQYESGTCTGPALAKCVRCATKDYGPLRGPALALGQRAGRRMLRRADAYLAISGTVAAAARQVLPPDMEIDLVPSMVPEGLAELAESTPRPDFLPPEDGYLLFVGALGPHKGVDVLLDAYRKLRHRNVPLVLIGTPRADTPKIDDPNVYIVRDVPSAKVMSAWRHSSIAIVPSVWEEPMGQVAVEAMLAERPVVASDVGGLRDIVVNDETGIRVPPRDPAALAEAIDRLLDDPALRKQMGIVGRERAMRYTSQVVVPEVLAVFESVLERRRPGSGTAVR
jgi:glycosyltransferase involved in cell wall biosynthesis